MLTPVLLTMVLSSAAATFHCAAHTSRAIPTLVASNGTRFTLRVDMDDDHTKSTHLCEAGFTFAAALPNQPESRNNPYLSDDAWDRPIAVEIYGFNADDSRVFGMIREGASQPSTTLFSYSIASRDLLTANLNLTLRDRLPRACMASLTVVGTTGRSDRSGIVLAARPAPLCPRRRFALVLAHDPAQRDIVRSLHALPAGALVFPLDPGRTQP